MAALVFVELAGSIFKPLSRWKQWCFSLYQAVPSWNTLSTSVVISGYCLWRAVCCFLCGHFSCWSALKGLREFRGHSPGPGQLQSFKICLRVIFGKYQWPEQVLQTHNTKESLSPAFRKCCRISETWSKLYVGRRKLFLKFLTSSWKYDAQRNNDRRRLFTRWEQDSPSATSLHTVIRWNHIRTLTLPKKILIT